MDDFREKAQAALALAGVDVTESDLLVLESVASAFEPGLRALDRVDLSELPIESDLDPGRPPRERPDP